MAQPQTQQKKTNNVTSNTNVNLNKNVATGKKLEQNATDYSQEQPGYVPWPMSPMGFYMPPGMNYDPNQMMGTNPMGYPMMPMY